MSRGQMTLIVLVVSLLCIGYVLVRCNSDVVSNTGKLEGHAGLSPIHDVFPEPKAKAEEPKKVVKVIEEKKKCCEVVKNDVIALGCDCKNCQCLVCTCVDCKCIDCPGKETKVVVVVKPQPKPEEDKVLPDLVELKVLPSPANNAACANGQCTQQTQTYYEDRPRFFPRLFRRR